MTRSTLPRYPSVAAASGEGCPCSRRTVRLAPRVATRPPISATESHRAAVRTHVSHRARGGGTEPSQQRIHRRAGLGRSSQWYRNLQVHEGIEVAIARERFAPVHRELPISEAEVVLSAYEQRNRFLAPVAHQALSWLVGWRYDGTQAARQRVVGELPLIGCDRRGRNLQENRSTPRSTATWDEARR